MSVKISAYNDGSLSVNLVHENSGSKLVTTAPKDNGGDGSSFSPTDLLASSYAACMMTIAALHAKKNKFELGESTIHLEKIMSIDLPRRVHELKIFWTLSKKIALEEREALIEAAKNCPVAKSIHPNISISLNTEFSLD
jgi:putative redox protein